MKTTAKLTQDKSRRVSKYLRPNFGGAAVKVRVGHPDVKCFFLQKDFICSRSKFFNKALKGDYTEAKEMKVELPEHDPELFELYIQLCYTGQVSVKEAKIMDSQSSDTDSDSDGDATVDEDQFRHDAQAEILKLSQLYVLARKLKDREAMNATVDALVEAAHEDRGDHRIYYPDPEAVSLLYAGTVQFDPVRLLFASLYVDYSDKTWGKGSTYDQFPHEFLFDMFRGMANCRDLPREKSQTTDSSNFYWKRKKKGLEESLPITDAQPGEKTKEFEGGNMQE